MTELAEIPTNCDGCGACCMGQNLLPLTGNDIDGVGLPDELHAELLAILEGPLAGHDDCPCVWLNRATGKCRHYEHRPNTCREVVQVGDEACLRIRAEAFAFEGADGGS